MHCVTENLALWKKLLVSSKQVHFKKTSKTLCTDGRVPDEVRERVPDYGAGNWKDTTAVSVEPVSVKLGPRRNWNSNYKCTLTRYQNKTIKYSFVRSFIAGRGPAYSEPQRRDHSPVLLPRETKGIGKYVRCVLVTCGEGRLSRSEQLIGYFYSAPLLDVAYCPA